MGTAIKLKELSLVLCDDLDGWDGGGGGRKSKREKIYMYVAAAKSLQ